MNDVKELKEEELEQVSGGSCYAYDPRPGYGGQGGASPNARFCEECIHYQRPEGPCTLGFGENCNGQIG